MNNSKGKYALWILENLAKTAATASDVLTAFLEAGYGAPISKINRRLSEIQYRRRRREYELLTRARSVKRYHNLLAWLKRDGLLIEQMHSGKKLLRPTKKGLERLHLLRERSSLPRHFQAEKSPHWTIVVFDIPEREARKRRWLRFALKDLGFRMLQKSVWIGKVKLPVEFIDHLSILKITDFVEILQITKAGSIRSAAEN